MRGQDRRSLRNRALHTRNEGGQPSAGKATAHQPDMLAGTCIPVLGSTIIIATVACHGLSVQQGSVPGMMEA